MSDTDQEQSITTWNLLRLAVRSLGQAARLWATLTLSAALFGAALFLPAAPHTMYIRLGGAVAFTLMVHVPLWYRAKGGSE